MTKKKVMVFDFDGTLVKSEWYVRYVSRDYLSKENLKIFNREGFPGLLAQKKISMFRLLNLLRKGRNEWIKYLDKFEVVEELKDVLLEMKKKGWILGLLTSNKMRNVKAVFEKYNWDFFDFYYSGLDIFGKDKVILKMLKDKGFDKEEVIYVGDEIRDVEACNKIGIKMIGVTWGYNSKKSLKKADYLVDTPTDFRKLVLSLSQ